MNKTYDIGRAAYAAYSETVGGKAFDGSPLLTFDQLDEVKQAGWEAAGIAGADALSKKEAS